MEVIEKPESIMNNHYESIVEYYNKMYSTQIYDYNIRINSWVLDNINNIPRGNVLEIGIGLGTNIELYINNGFLVHGIDISEVAIEKLKMKYMNNNCSFYCNNISETILPENTYNLIVCSMSLHYLSDHDIIEVINNIKKSLRESGYIYIKVLSTEDALYKSSNNKLVKHFFTKEEILALFSDMHVVELTQTITQDNIRNLDNRNWGIIECAAIKL